MNVSKYSVLRCMICHNWLARSATPKMQLIMISTAELRAVSACMNCRQVTTSFQGSLFSASLSRWNRDPGCGWSRDHLSIQNRNVGGYSSTFGWEENPVAPPFQQIFLPPGFCVVTWTAATSVSVPTPKGGREESPWEWGWASNWA